MDSVDTKTMLLDAGKHLFAQKGFHGVSVKEICERAKVNVSLVSYYFEGKEGLYQACLERFSRDKLATAERILVKPKSADELRLRLLMFADEMMLCHVSDPETARMVHRAVILESDIAASVFDRTFVPLFDSFVGFLRDAKTQGLVRSELDPFLAATNFFGALMHLVITDEFRSRRFGPTLSIANEKFRKNAEEHWVEIFVRGIGSPTS
jgi:AcrR family transcriptional regulator